MQDKIIEQVEKGQITWDEADEALAKLQKGNFGEMKMDQVMRDKGYERIMGNPVTDLNAPTHKGIDGIYYKPDGHPPYVIADAKYHTATLNTTKTMGRQMSAEWIEARLDSAVTEGSITSAMRDDILSAMAHDNAGSYVVQIAEHGNISDPVVFKQVDEAGYITGRVDF